MLESNLVHICFWLVACESHIAAESLSASISVLPLLVNETVLILPVVSPKSEIVLFSSSLNWVGLMWAWLEFFIPAIMNYLALMPSFAASFGFVSEGGLISADA